MFSNTRRGYGGTNNDTVVLNYRCYPLLYKPVRASLYGHEKI